MSDYSRQNPSERYKELNTYYRQLHKEGEKNLNLEAEKTFPGFSVLSQVERIKDLCELYSAENLLDYGSGKGQQYSVPLVDVGGSEKELLVDYWDVMSVHCYDPAYEPFIKLPDETFDGVISTDVLEHCPEDDVDWIVGEMFSFAKTFVLANVACYPAKKTLPNGENAHTTIKPAEWWVEKFAAASAASGVEKWVLVITTIEEGKPREVVYQNQ